MTGDKRCMRTRAPGNAVNGLLSKQSLVLQDDAQDRGHAGTLVVEEAILQDSVGGATPVQTPSVPQAPQTGAAAACVSCARLKLELSAKHVEELERVQREAAAERDRQRQREEQVYLAQCASIQRLEQLLKEKTEHCELMHTAAQTAEADARHTQARDEGYQVTIRLLEQQLASKCEEEESAIANTRTAEAEIARLQALVARGQTELLSWSSLQDNVSSAQDEVTRLELEVKSRSEQIAALERRLEEQQQDRHAWAEMERKYVEVKAALDQALAGKSAALASLDEAVRRNSRLDQERGELVSTLGTVAAARDQSSALEAQQRRHSEVVSQFQTQFDELRAEVRTVAERNTLLSAEVLLRTGRGGGGVEDAGGESLGQGKEETEVVEDEAEETRKADENAARDHLEKSIRALTSTVKIQMESLVSWNLRREAEAPEVNGNRQFADESGTLETLADEPGCHALERPTAAAQKRGGGWVAAKEVRGKDDFFAGGNDRGGTYAPQRMFRSFPAPPSLQHLDDPFESRHGTPQQQIAQRAAARDTFVRANGPAWNTGQRPDVPRSLFRDDLLPRTGWHRTQSARGWGPFSSLYVPDRRRRNAYEDSDEGWGESREALERDAGWFWGHGSPWQGENEEARCEWGVAREQQLVPHIWRDMNVREGEQESLPRYVRVHKQDVGGGPTVVNNLLSYYARATPSTPRSLSSAGGAGNNNAHASGGGNWDARESRVAGNTGARAQQRYTHGTLKERVLRGFARLERNFYMYADGLSYLTYAIRGVLYLR